MKELFAKDFFQILDVLNKNDKLRVCMLNLIKSKPILGKSIEEKPRQEILRNILMELINKEIKNLDESYKKGELKLPESQSKYYGNKRIFSRGWAERLIRTQFSRFYNQAVMEILIEGGHKECFIPHSKYEDPNTECTIKLAGKTHNINELYQNLIEIYEKENYSSRLLTIPHHPHCTHVITPVNFEE